MQELENKEFNNLLCESLLLSLYQQNKLTKTQYEECIKLLKNK